jgi:hypothetical protein
MKIKCVLLVDDTGAVWARKGMPKAGSLHEFQVAIPLTVHVPDGWFSARTGVVDVNVPEPADRGDVTIEVVEVRRGTPSAVFDLEDYEDDENAQPEVQP